MKVKEAIEQLSGLSPDAVLVIVNEESGAVWTPERMCMTEDPGGPNGADEAWIVLSDEA